MSSLHLSRTAPTWTPSSATAWQVHTRLSSDIDEHAAELQRWQQVYDQLSKGRFHGRLSQVLTDTTQVYREETSQTLRQRCKIPDDAVWCGITLRHDGSCIGGHTVGERGVMVCGSGSEFDLISPAGHDLVGIATSRSALQAHAQGLGIEISWSAIDHSPWVEVSPARRRTAVAGLRAILSMAAHAAQPHLRAEAVRDSLRLAMLDVIVGLFEHVPASRESRINSTERRHLVQRIHEWVLANPQRVPNIPDLCREFNISRRTLQYAFEAAAHVGPNAYLRSIRLNGARRTLRRAHPSSTTVQDVAAGWGFLNLSQFASDYRAQFGERPSQTLARIQA